MSAQDQDWSHLSDDQLQQIANGQGQSNNQDWSHLSDDQLKQIAAKGQSQQPSTLARLRDAGINSLPQIGAGVGGLLGAEAGGIGAVPGAMAGGAVGTAAKGIAEGIRDQGWDYFKQKPSVGGSMQAVSQEAGGAALGGLQQKAGELIGKGLQKTTQAVKSGTKTGIDAIRQASARLGISPTAGMTSSSTVTQGLESSLDQSPSLAGALVRSDTEPVKEGLENASQELLANTANGSAQRTAANVRSGISSSLGSDYNSIQMAYEPFNNELPKMIPDNEAKWQLADKIASAGQGNLSLTKDMSGYAEKVANKVMASNNLADLENVRKQIGQAAQEAYGSRDFNAYDALSKMRDNLADFRDTQFIKLAQQNYPSEGGTSLGNQMVDEYANAQGMYKQMADKLRYVGDIFGIKNQNPKDFIESVQQIPPDKLYSKLMNTNNFEAMQTIKDVFPQEFDQLRNMKMQEIAQSSMVKGINGAPQINPGAVVKNVEKLDPEVQQLIFGKRLDTLQDLKTVINSLPAKMGPSGTPQGQLFNQSWNPALQATEIGRYGLYKASASPAVQGAANMINKGASSKAAPAVLGLAARNAPALGNAAVSGAGGLLNYAGGLINGR